MRLLIAPMIVAPLVFGGLPAMAQGHPSADQIINSLKPSGNLVMGGTRGIRLVAPTNEAATQQPAPSPAQQPRVASSKPVAVPMAPPAPVSGPAVNLTVNFANGSADLTPDAIRTLDALGRALASQDLAGYHFRIEGHTDTVGSSRLQSHTLRAARRSSGGLRREEVRRGTEPVAGGRHGRRGPAGGDAPADTGAAQSPRAGDQPRRLTRTAPAADA